MKRVWHKFIMSLLEIIRFMIKKIFIFTIFVFLSSCASSINVYKNEKIKVTYPIELKNGKHLPLNINIMDSMNNVDLVSHNNKYYMAFRTSPTHFASTETLIHLLSSDNGIKWDIEKTFHLNSDLREPRFLSYNSKLFFYFFKGGTNPFNFEPENMYVSYLGDNNKWSEPQKFFEYGYVPWRARVHNGKAYMSVYYGRDLYGNQKSGAIYLLRSTDGLNWEKISETPQITIPHAEEPEFEFDDKGNIWGTIRLESEGGMLFFADKNDLSNWKTIKVKEKYDSALILNHNENFYLISRRNIDGTMDKAPEYLPYNIRAIYNLLRYSFTPKRTAIYYYDRENMKITPLVDIKSHGDTAFPAIAKISNNNYLLLNYSSLIEHIKDDYIWIYGQLNPTKIYSQRLSFDN